MLTQMTANVPPTPLVSHEERTMMAAVENLRRFVPGGHELFEDLCTDTYSTIQLLQTHPPKTAVEFAVKRELARLNLERQRSLMAVG